MGLGGLVGGLIKTVGGGLLSNVLGGLGGGLFGGGVEQKKEQERGRTGTPGVGTGSTRSPAKKAKASRLSLIKSKQGGLTDTGLPSSGRGKLLGN